MLTRRAVVLSDRSIREAVEKGRIVINPLDDDDIQPASVDVHLADELLVFRNARRPYIDLRREMEDLTDMVEISDEDGFNLHPGEFVSGQHGGAHRDSRRPGGAA